MYILDSSTVWCNYNHCFPRGRKFKEENIGTALALPSRVVFLPLSIFQLFYPGLLFANGRIDRFGWLAFDSFSLEVGKLSSRKHFGWDVAHPIAAAQLFTKMRPAWQWDVREVKINKLFDRQLRPTNDRKGWGKVGENARRCSICTLEERFKVKPNLSVHASEVYTWQTLSRFKPFITPYRVC